MFRAADQSLSKFCTRIAYVVVVGCVCAGSPAARSQTTREWIGPVGGDWYTATNWNPTGTPASSDFLTLAAGDEPNAGAGTEISFGGFIDMSSTANATLGAVFVGSDGYGTLAMSGGSILTSSFGIIGHAKNAVGLANIGTGTTWNVVGGNSLTVGNQGQGTLNITSGADVISTGFGVIGSSSSGTGTINVSGAGSLLDFASILRIGDSGTGTLNISNDAVVENSSATIGYFPGSLGRVTIDSRGTWTTTEIEVGNAGLGTLEIRGGGQATTDTVTIGKLAAGVGRVLVDGTDSLCDSGGVILVGNSGHGDLEIRNGARVENSAGYIGYGVTGTGQVIVRNGATWSNSGSLIVGGDGEGSLLVEQGALVETTGGGVIGLGASSDGEATVDGIGSAWISSLGLNVGTSGIGALNVSGGATVSNQGSLVGVFSGSQGTVNVLGPGSYWDVSTGNITLGVSGEGNLNVSSGGSVSVGTELMIADDASSISSVTVSGSGSELNAADDLVVGNLGTATMTIREQATVTVAGATTVGSGDTLSIENATFTTDGLQSAGTFNFISGTVTIDGGTLFDGGNYTLDSTTLATMNLINGAVENDDELTVGDSGNAVLNLSGGSTFANGATMYVARQAGSSGVVNATGPGSSITPSDFIFVGNGGQGELHLSGGANAQSSEIHIGAAAGSTGVVNVSGPTTTLGAMLDNLYVGESGRGELHLSDSADANFNHVFLGLNNGGQGTITVESGATLTAAGNLDVKRDSLLSIDGGFVNVVNDQTTLSGNSTIELNDGQLRVEALVATDAGSRLQFNGGTLIVESLLQMQHTVTVPAGGRVELQGDIVGNIASQPGSTMTIEAATASMGDVNSTNAINLQGSLNVGANTLTLNSFVVPARLGENTNLDGGQINAPAGVSLGDGDALGSSGTVNGKVAAGVGSVILGAALTLGDSTKFDGFVSDGTLWSVSDTITLLDANEAVLGSLTQLGHPLVPGTPGNVAAANGLVLDFGRNIIGFGTVDTPNDPQKPFINNGHIEGNSGAEPITLTGYVKGVGTMNNVVITGTSAPGFSPATVYYGSVEYAGTLEIELAGVGIGNFDRIVHSGVAELGGALDVALINGFSPARGHAFEILTAASGVSGTFASTNLPALSGNLVWNVSYGANSVTLDIRRAANGTVIFDDTFDVGAPPTRGDDAADPLDVQWYRSTAAMLSVADDAAGIGSANALNVDNSPSFGKFGGNFETVLLDDLGDEATLSFDFRRLTDGTPAGSGPSFRFGLYDNGGTALAGDTTNVLSNTTNDNGYRITLGVGGSGAFATRETAESNGILGGPAGANELLLGAGLGAAFDGLNDADPHEIVLTLTRVAAGVKIQVTVDGMTFIDVTDEGIDPDTNLPAGLFISEFDVIGFGIGSTDVAFDYRLDNIRLVVASLIALDGDYNGDGRVDAGDYVRWRNNLGDADETDINNSGDGGGVTIDDYAWWKANYGKPYDSGGGGSLSAPTPEPTASVLALLASAVLSVAYRPRISSEKLFASGRPRRRCVEIQTRT